MRHVARRGDHPQLFDDPMANSEIEQHRCRERDRSERKHYEQEFAELLQRAVELSGNVESEVILRIKAESDRLYTIVAGLEGERAEMLGALRKLTETIMASLWFAAGDDPQAAMEFEQEELARKQHYTLLEEPLVSDLMRPDTPIEADQLIPVLLSAEEPALHAALWLFGPEQLETIIDEGRRLIGGLKLEEHQRARYLENIELIAEHLEMGREDGSDSPP